MVADILKSSLNAEVLEIKTQDEKKRFGPGKFFWALSLALSKKEPALKPCTVDIGNYDLIILGAPVWAGAPALMMASFLKQTKITGKKVALFCSHGGGAGKALERFKALLPGNTIAGEIDFRNPAKADRGELKLKIGAWARTLGN
jgi:flavodoxin